MTQVSEQSRRFEGRVAIVTGAARGIGEAYARALAAAGAAVAIADLNDEAATAVAADITAHGGQAAAVRVDVSDPDSTREMAGFAASTFGGVDYLVNNAAVYGDMKLDLLLTVDWDYYRSFMAVNMDGALLCARACYPHMVERGGGAIVNQSSTAAWLYAGYYGLAKAGVNGLTQQLAHELGGIGDPRQRRRAGPDRHGGHAQRRTGEHDRRHGGEPRPQADRPA